MISWKIYENFEEVLCEEVQRKFQLNFMESLGNFVEIIKKKLSYFYIKVSWKFYQNFKKILGNFPENFRKILEKKLDFLQDYFAEILMKI